MPSNNLNPRLRRNVAWQTAMLKHPRIGCKSPFFFAHRAGRLETTYPGDWNRSRALRKAFLSSHAIPGPETPGISPEQARQIIVKRESHQAKEDGNSQTLPDELSFFRDRVSLQQFYTVIH